MMDRSRLSKLFAMLFFVIMSIAVVNPFSSVSANSDFQAGNIISDSVFFNPNTMSADEIQSFLNSKVPSCDVNGVKPSGRSGYPTRADWGRHKGVPPPYKCIRDFTDNVPSVAADAYCQSINGGTKTAAQIIKDVTLACSINPQAMLVLIQKEQGLIADDWGWPYQFKFATGFCVYDTVAPPSCADTDGFFKQVYYAARVLQRYGKDPNKNSFFNFHPTKINRIGYNPNASCGHADVHVENQATAGLYNYTPYQPNAAALAASPGTEVNCGAYGNLNFYRFFINWFGSVHGDLVRTVDNGTVYLVSGMTKYPISSMVVYNDLSVMGPLRFVKTSYLDSLTTGPTVGSMVRSPNGGLYFINSGIKLGFTNCDGDVIDYGYTCDSPFVELSSQQINKLSNGPAVTKLIKSNNNGTIYYMQQGKKRPLTSWKDLTSLNIPLSWNVFGSARVDTIPQGANMFGPTAMIKKADNGTVYIVKNDSQLYTLNSFIPILELGINSRTRTISDGDMKTYSVDAGLLRNKVRCNNKNYVGTNGKVHLVSEETMTAYGYVPHDFLEVGSAFCSNLTVNQKGLTRYVRTDDGSIFYVDTGTKRAFTSFTTYLNHGGTANNTVAVSDHFATGLISGANIPNNP